MTNKPKEKTKMSNLLAQNNWGKQMVSLQPKAKLKQFQDAFLEKKATRLIKSLVELGL